MSGHKISDPKKLTQKQETYMRYLAQGLSNADIAERMGVMMHTIIINYEYCMLSKTYLNTREELVEYAKQHYGVQTHG